MKKLLLLSALALFTACGASRWPSEKFIAENNYQAVRGHLGPEDPVLETPPMYPGGWAGINAFIIKNTRYPQQAQREGLHGRVVIQYIIGTDGYVDNVEVLESAHPLLDAEAKRVIGLMGRWIPGKQKGKPVRVMLRQPFMF